jgi:hypothetical protein
MTVHVVPPDTPTKAPREVACADCVHCKVFKETSPSGSYVLRVRCAKDRWRKGKEQTVATYHFHTVLRRRVPGCPDYGSLSDGRSDHADYLAQLADELPVEVIVYAPDGEPVAPREVR